MDRASPKGMWGRGAYLVIVSQKLVQKVNGFVGHKSLVLGVDEAVPRLLGEAAQDVVVLRVEFYLVLVEVVEEIVGAENLCNLDELIRVAGAVEEGLLAEDHGGKHGAQTPHIQAVVIFLEIYQQLWAFEVAGSNLEEVKSVPCFGQRRVDGNRQRVVII